MVARQRRQRPSGAHRRHGEARLRGDDRAGDIKATWPGQAERTGIGPGHRDRVHGSGGRQKREGRRATGRRHTEANHISASRAACRCLRPSRHQCTCRIRTCAEPGSCLPPVASDTAPRPAARNGFLRQQQAMVARVGKKTPLDWPMRPLLSAAPVPMSCRRAPALPPPAKLAHALLCFVALPWQHPGSVHVVSGRSSD